MQLNSRFVAVTAAGVLAIAPGVALAAGANSVSIKAQHKAHLGKKFNYKVKGKSSSAHNSLATFINTSTKCAKTFKSEAKVNGFPPVGNETLQPLPKGHFTRKFTVTPSSLGPHQICAYVVSRKGKTLARATSNYNTKA